MSNATEMRTEDHRKAAERACEAEGGHGIDLELSVEPALQYHTPMFIVTECCCYCGGNVSEGKTYTAEQFAVLATELYESQAAQRDERQRVLRAKAEERQAAERAQRDAERAARRAGR
jgi:hypothetical protein